MKKDISTQNVSLRIIDSDGKKVSDNELLLHGDIALEDDQTLSLMSIVKLLTPLEKLSTPVPCTVKGERSRCEVKVDSLRNDTSGCALIVTTHGQDAKEVIKLHNNVYSTLVPEYEMIPEEPEVTEESTVTIELVLVDPAVMVKPVLVAEGWLAKKLAKFLNWLLPKLGIQILLEEQKDSTQEEDSQEDLGELEQDELQQEEESGQDELQQEEESGQDELQQEDSTQEEE